MTIKEIRETLGYRSIRDMGDKLNINYRTLQAMTPKDKEKQQPHVNKIMRLHFGVTNRDILNLVVEHNKKIDE